MRFRYAQTLALAIACSSLCGAADAPIRFPSPPEPDKIPVPPDTAIKLTKGQFYVITSSKELLVDAVSGDGTVTIASRKGPLMLPAELAVGYKPDATDPEFVTFTDPFIYIVKAGSKSGMVGIQTIPTTNDVDKDGKQIPLKRSDIVKKSIIVDSGTGPRPPPTPVDPPGPTPKPADPAPIPVAGLRVLIVYESADLPKMTPAQNGIIFSAAVRTYLNTNCAVGPDGKTKEFRMWDKDIDASGDSPLWQTAFKRPRTSTPWVLISNGTTGYEGPLPADVTGFLELCKRYEVK